MKAAVSSFRASLDRTQATLARWLAPGTPSQQNNALNLYREIAWYGVTASVTTTFTSVFALRLGASNLLIGLLASLPALMNVVFQIPAARLIEQTQDRRRVLLMSGLLMRLPVGLIALVPFFAGHWQAEAVVLITSLGTIPAAVANVVFTAMLADVVPPHRRARVVSVRNTLLSAVTMLTALAVGKALDLFVFPFSYQAIFALAFATSLVSLFYLARVDVPLHVPSPAPRLLSGWSDIQRWVRSVWDQRAFSRFTLGSFVFHWALSFPQPLYSIYRVRVLGMSEGWIGALSMLESAIFMASYYVWGKAAEKHGSRLVLLVGTAGLSFYPLSMGLCRSIPPMILVAVLSGVAAPAFNLGLFNALLEVAPAERRATYVAIFNTLVNLTAFIAPLVAAALAGVIGTRVSLLLAGGLRFVGLAVFYLLLRDPVTGRVRV
ncbi:MAG: Major Facilitator Superfamily protein [Chloroflexi bacterium ADurb.Bin180]|nr:MAG: Major Facilitator Superfamily protein [Chloroflexi bacterium ADurb.Bin180]